MARSTTPSGVRPRPSNDTARRLVGLKGRARALLVDLARQVERGDVAGAWATWLAASREAPGHAELLRWSARLHLAQGNADAALTALRDALATDGDDAELLRLLGSTLFASRQPLAAADALRASARNTVEAADWLPLGLAFDQQGLAEDALAAAEHALAADPASTQARLLRARELSALGRVDEAAQDYRRVIARGEHAARAWFALLDLKTQTIDETALAALVQAERAATSADDRSLLGFALGRALEATGRYDDAFAAFTRANRAAAGSRPWDAAAFDAQVASLQSAAPRAVAEPARGSEVIFLVGLPRSGSTLIEQVLAAHSQVEGASELPYLERVLSEEGRRRGRALHEWMPQASAQDWARLGDEYLAATARWREHAPRATDKMPGNWLFVDAALAMLPGARVIDCRRDALETCWSCHKQLFAPGQADFSVRVPDLARYWHAYRQFCDTAGARHPSRMRTFRYEELVDAPEAFVRALLAFCGLDFEAACLHPHEAQRSIRTASAAQVREPIRRVPSNAQHYGVLLDPLRDLLRDSR